MVPASYFFKLKIPTKIIEMNIRSGKPVIETVMVPPDKLCKVNDCLNSHRTSTAKKVIMNKLCNV